MAEIQGDTEFRQMEHFEVEDPNAETLKVYTIRLNKGISKLNYICSQIYFLLATANFFMTDSLQPLILLDKDYYHIEREHEGTILGVILIIQLFIKVSGALLLGHFTDKFGRRKMLTLATIFICMGCVLIPTQKTVFPGFILCKIILALGNTILVILPFNADYVHDESKGRAAGFSITISAVGAIVGNVVLKIFLLDKLSLGTIYTIWGVFLLIILNLVNLGLKGGNYYYKIKNNFPTTDNHLSLKEVIEDAFQVFKQTPWLLIALFLQIMGNADFYILTVVFALFIKALFPEGTPDSVSNMYVNNIQTLTLVLALLSNLIYGWYIDKTKKIMNAVYTALIGGIIGFSFSITVNQPTDVALYIGAAVLGCTLTGIYTSAQYLGITYFPQEKRGVLQGIMGAFGYIGYMILAAGGGYLFDVWKKTAPFIINIIFLILCLIGVYYIYRVKIMTKTY